MLPAVEGPGLVVTLDDSPLWENMVDSSGSTSNINDYVVHQQDVEAVVNALWAGGAESMMIMDQRVLFNSAVLQLAVIYIPFLNIAFGTVPLSAGAWVECLGLAMIVLIASELRKCVLRAR